MARDRFQVKTREYLPWKSLEYTQVPAVGLPGRGWMCVMTRMCWCFGLMLAGFPYHSPDFLSARKYNAEWSTTVRFTWESTDAERRGGCCNHRAKVGEGQSGGAQTPTGMVPIAGLSGFTPYPRALLSNLCKLAVAQVLHVRVRRIAVGHLSHE